MPSESPPQEGNLSQSTAVRSVPWPTQPRVVVAGKPVTWADVAAEDSGAMSFRLETKALFAREAEEGTG
jgi:hypothetical protein